MNKIYSGTKCTLFCFLIENISFECRLSCIILCRNLAHVKFPSLKHWLATKSSNILFLEEDWERTHTVSSLDRVCKVYSKSCTCSFMKGRSLGLSSSKRCKGVWGGYLFKMKSISSPLISFWLRRTYSVNL